LRREPQNRISPKAVTVWKITAVIWSIVELLVIIGISLLIFFFNWPKWIIPILAIIWLVSSICSIFIFPNIRLKIWRYEVHENELDLQHGLFTVTRVLVPMVRVQHVDTSQGPILRKYNLATVTISTAATVHEIPALEMEEADQLRDYISKLAREAKDDV
jgi:membrane protein YdbS with pleckstrin-like domain